MCLDPDSLSHSGGEGLGDGVQFSVWVSYYEIYNEFLYDLLEATPTGMLKKRANLKLSDDKQGNPYVKGKGAPLISVSHTCKLFIFLYLCLSL